MLQPHVVCQVTPVVAVTINDCDLGYAVLAPRKPPIPPTSGGARFPPELGGRGAKAPQCRQRDAGSQNNLRWAAPERNAATGADMWVSHRTGRPPGAVLRSGEAYEDLLAALGIEADSGLDRAGIVFLGKRMLL